MAVTFNIPPALRQDGTVIESQVINYQGQFTLFDGTITGLGTGPGSDYENPANHMVFGLYYEDPESPGSYLLGPGFTWTGGPFVKRDGTVDPPPQLRCGMAFPLGNIKLRVSISGTFTAGISGTLS